MIRAAREADVEAMRAIEVAADRMFRDIGMDFGPAGEPPTAETLLAYVRDGRAWVAEGSVAYLVADLVDGNVHVEQVSVDPAHGRRGLGAALIEHVAAWARERGSPALTLTTFAEVAWNAPYYERLGFRRLADAELTPELRRIRQREAEFGLDRWPRLAMRRELS
ncbi:GNAT family N-acetyltransferase [Actinoplanes sp. NPDC051513]|uniref:GNAT family N-acetyltransferase n=1 Tax=Actinoplanes sp. NPDC051513 TaxID=3363908 RepID=UPI00379703B7